MSEKKIIGTDTEIKRSLRRYAGSTECTERIKIYDVYDDDSRKLRVQRENERTREIRN